jgi:hypothetical protein
MDQLQEYMRVVVVDIGLICQVLVEQLELLVEEDKLEITQEILL